MFARMHPKDTVICRTSSMNSTPGTISALPSSRHSATWLQDETWGSRWSILPPSMMAGQLTTLVVDRGFCVVVDKMQQK